MKGKQFPVRAAFGVTCNKSQGQTFHTVGIYLHRPLFSHGQLYVALSRKGAPHRLKVLNRKQTRDHGMHYTDNVVYPESLRQPLQCMSFLSYFGLAGLCCSFALFQ